MNRWRIAKTVLAAALAAACGAALAACGGTGATTDADVVAEASGTDVSDTSQGVAATVGDVEIGEKAVTDYIESFRSQQQLEDESTWAQWLVDGGYTPDGIRSQVVDTFANQQLVLRAAEENGVSVEEADVDAQMQSMEEQYGSAEQLDSALASMGMSRESMRAQIELGMLEDRLKEKVATASEPDPDELDSYAQMYAAAYNGAKKSSHILFASDDEATAQQVLDSINAGELDFAEAARQYSIDEGSAQDGGNVGWDCLATFVTDYQTALDGLEEGQTSGLVTSPFGIHIIRCTEVYAAPQGAVTIDQIPTEFADSIRGALEEASLEESYQQWFEAYRDEVGVTVEEMPSDMPYDVDLSGYEPSESSE